MEGTVRKLARRKRVNWGPSLISVLLGIAGCATPAWKWDGTPTNDLPSPYSSVAPWGKLPEGHKWGALNGVVVDNDGRSLWVVDRCGANPDVPPGASPFQYDRCGPLRAGAARHHGGAHAGHEKTRPTH